MIINRPKLLRLHRYKPHCHHELLREVAMFLLGTKSLKYQRPRQIGVKPVSRRFKPSSRTSLNGEQPYPWDLLQPQDEMSRHRGAEQTRRYGLLAPTSLLSPG